MLERKKGHQGPNDSSTGAGLQEPADLLAAVMALGPYSNDGLGWVYILSQPQTRALTPGAPRRPTLELYKVGETERDPAVRADECYPTGTGANGSGVPLPFEVECAAYCTKRQVFERAFHLIHDERRVNRDREFFRMTIPEIIAGFFRTQEYLAQADGQRRSEIVLLAASPDALAENRQLLNQFQFVEVGEILNRYGSGPSDSPGTVVEEVARFKADAERRSRKLTDSRNVIGVTRSTFWSASTVAAIVFAPSIAEAGPVLLATGLAAALVSAGVVRALMDQVENWIERRYRNLGQSHLARLARETSERLFSGSRRDPERERLILLAPAPPELLASLARP